MGNYWLVGGASNTGGNVLEKYFTVNEIINFSKYINPNNIRGLEYYLFSKNGERFPKNDPKLKPCITPRPKNEALFLHGLFEGMAKIEKNLTILFLNLVGFFQNIFLQLVVVQQTVYGKKLE